MEVFLVGIGGAVGAILRWWLSREFNTNALPFGTLLVNAIGALLIGVVMGLMLSRPQLAVYRPLMVSGFLGGLTTYSSFAWESVALWQSGQLWLALANVLLNTVVCLILVVVGYNLRTIF